LFFVAPIEHLPDELLQEVLLRLPRSDVKAARLTCTLLANNGAHHLFKRIYFVPRRKIMEDFRNITSHPVFGKIVKELVAKSTKAIDAKVPGVLVGSNSPYM